MKTIIVTGSAGGIGKRVCHYFYQKGYNVIGVDIKQTYDPYITFKADLTDPEITAATIKKHLDNLNILTVDILVNNAAIQIKKDFLQVRSYDFRQSFDINVIAPAILIQELHDYLIGGSVVNIGSIHAKQTKPKFSVYATTKGALKTLTHSLALELAPDIRVNGIEPAAIDTPMLKSGLSKKELQILSSYHPMKTIGNSDHISTTIEFLHNNGFITGTLIEIDGGISKLLNDPENK